MSHSESANGVKYHQVFIHLQTRKVLTYAMRTKSEYPEKLKEFLIDYKALYPDRDKPELKVINDIIFMGEPKAFESIEVLISDNAPEIVALKFNI